MTTSYKISEKELSSIKTICVLCWGLIGDVFIRVSLLEALKERFPDAKMTVVVDPSSRVAIETHKDVDEIILFSRKKKPLLRYIINTVKNVLALRRRRFDLSVNLYSGGASPRITRLINARLRLGFDHTEALRRSNNIQVKHPDWCENWTVGFGTVLKPLGIHQVRRGTSYTCTEEALQFAEQWLKELPEKKLVVNLGAGAEEKIWPIRNFADLLLRVQTESDYHPILLSNPGQHYLLEEFARVSDKRLKYSVFPLMSFANDAALIKKVGLIITGDTSIMHLAFGLKCPTLGMFTYTRPEIVDPEDCLHVACFQEGTMMNKCGRMSGTRDMSVDYCYSKFTELLDQLA